MMTASPQHPESLRKALPTPSLAYATLGEKKAGFFLSSNFNDLRHLIDGTSMCRVISAHVRRDSLSMATLLNRVLGCILALLCSASLFAGMSVTITAKEREALVAKLLEAFNRQDAQGMSELVTNDVQWLNIDGERTSPDASSRQELIEGMTAYFKSCPSCRSRLSEIMTSSDRLAAIEVAEWEKAGVKHSQSSISVYEFQGNLIRRVYYFPAERP
jgi:ketosteroid isomerase-like protein